MQIRRRHPNPPVVIDSLQYQSSVPDSKPNHILEEIVWHKEREVAIWREKFPLLKLRQDVQSRPPTKDFLAAIRQGKTDPALIAEVKKASPSKGIICQNFNPTAIAQAYELGGASCLSVLTDEKFFQGSFENLNKIRQVTTLPLLCKEFIVYPYQIYLARLNGADAVLLIAAILGDRDLQYFLKIIHGLGMTALVEVHTLEELDRVLALEDIKLIGINNRNLEDFSVNLATTEDLIAKRSQFIQEREIWVVSESGLHLPSDLQRVRQAGANAVLIGESLVKTHNPAEAIRNLFESNREQ